MATSKTIEFEKAREYRKGEFLVSTDRVLIDLDVVHPFLTACYWAKGIPRDVVARSIETRCASACMLRANKSGSRA